MTRPIPFVPILMLLAAFAVTTLFVLPGMAAHAPEISVSLPAGQSQVDNDWMTMYHTDPSHDTRRKNSHARQIVDLVLATWSVATYGGSPPPQDQLRCGIIKAAGEVVRVAIWLADAPGAAIGSVAWYDVASREWGGAYTGKPLPKFETGPKVADKGWTWESNPDSCNQIPPGGLPPLQPVN